MRRHNLCDPDIRCIDAPRTGGPRTLLSKYHHLLSFLVAIPLLKNHNIRGKARNWGQKTERGTPKIKPIVRDHLPPVYPTWSRRFSFLLGEQFEYIQYHAG